MKTIIAILLLTIQVDIYSQYNYDHSINLDSIIKSRELKKCDRLDEIAQDLYVSDSFLQYLVFLRWITGYLSYKSTPDNVPIYQVLKYRKGDCHHYSVIMDSLCKYRGFDSEIVHGFVKTSVNNDHSFNLVAHAWTCIRINGKELYTDVLWSDEERIPSIGNDLDLTFVLKTKEEFALTHFSKKKKDRPKNWTFHRFMSYPLFTKQFMKMIVFDPILLKGKYRGLANFFDRLYIHSIWCDVTESIRGFYIAEDGFELIRLQSSNEKLGCKIILPVSWNESEHGCFSIVAGLLGESGQIKYVGLIDQ